MSKMQDDTNAALTGAAGGIFAATLTTAAEALAILDQQDLALDLVPTLSQTQALARSHATAWQNSYSTALLQALTIFQAYGAAVNSFAPQLADLAGQLASGDSSVRPQLLTGIKRLGTLAGAQQASNRNAATIIAAFLSLIADDAVRYNTDAATLARRFSGPQGELQQLQGALDALSVRLAKDNKTVADGAMQALPGAIIAGIGLGVAYVNTDVGKVLLQKGLTMAYGAVMEADAAMRDAASAISDYTATFVKLQSEKLEVAAFETVRQHVARLQDAVNQADSALQAADGAWQDEIGRLQLWTAAAQGTSPTTLADDIQDSAEFWASLSKAIGTYLVALQALPDEDQGGAATT